MRVVLSPEELEIPHRQRVAGLHGLTADYKRHTEFGLRVGYQVFNLDQHLVSAGGNQRRNLDFGGDLGHPRLILRRHVGDHFVLIDLGQRHALGVERLYRISHVDLFFRRLGIARNAATEEQRLPRHMFVSRRHGDAAIALRDDGPDHFQTGGGAHRGA